MRRSWRRWASDRARHSADAERAGAAAASAAEAADRAIRLASGADADDAPAGAAITAAAAAAAAAERLRAPARAGIDEIERRASELSAELQSCAADEAAGQVHAREVSTALTEIEVSLARSGERIDEIERRRAALAAEYSIEPPEMSAPLEPDEATVAAARLERLERRRESLGAVNPLAAEEYEEAKGRADELTDQCADLERSLKELRGPDPRPDADDRPPLRRDVRGGRQELRRGHLDALPGRVRAGFG